MEPGSLLAPRLPCPVACEVRGLPWVEALGAVPEARRAAPVAGEGSAVLFPCL